MLALQPTNPMRRALASILICEVIAFALAIPGMIFVEHVPAMTATIVGLVPVVLALVSCGLLKRTAGYLLAWLAQTTAVAVGAWTPWMYLLGGIFFMTWAVSFFLGKKLEATASL